MKFDHQDDRSDTKDVKVMQSLLTFFVLGKSSKEQVMQHVLLFYFCIFTFYSKEFESLEKALY